MSLPASWSGPPADDDRLLSEATRCVHGVRWTTRVFAQADGRLGATLVRAEGAEHVTWLHRRGAASLAALDALLSEALARRGPSGDERLAALCSAAVAVDEASRRAA